MIKNKKKNKIARRIVLSTLTFSSLLGVGLSLSSINGFKIQEENLVDNEQIKEINESSSNSKAVEETDLIEKPGVNFGDFYPFEIPVPSINTNVNINDPFWDFFSIAGSVQPIGDVTFRITSVSLKNNGSNERSGTISIQAIISRWINSEGQIGTNKPMTITVNNLRSVTGPTSIIPNPTVKPIDNVEYASDILTKPDDTAIRFLTPRNHIVGASDSKFDSTFQLSTTQSPTFDNTSGNLTIPATIGNYIDSGFRFVPESSGLYNQTVVVQGFKKITGETKFEANQPLASSTTPSVLLRNADSNGVLNESLQKQYFGEIKNPLTIKDSFDQLIPQTKLVPNGFVIKDPNDIDGTITVQISVTGGYYGYDSQNRLVPFPATLDDKPQTFSFVVSGFSKFVEKVDNTMTIVIASIGGGVGLIAVVIALIFLIKFQKKKSEEIRKKKSMDDKLHSMSSKPKKGPETSNASGMAPGGGMAPGRPGMPGGPQAPGKYVPPTISVPKSNAPVVKRPSGPTPPPAKK